MVSAVVVWSVVVALVGCVVTLVVEYGVVSSVVVPTVVSTVEDGLVGPVVEPKVGVVVGTEGVLGMVLLVVVPTVDTQLQHLYLILKSEQNPNCFEGQYSPLGTSQVTPGKKLEGTSSKLVTHSISMGFSQTFSSQEFLFSSSS